MGRIIEAKAVISAEDRTGKVLDGLARKFREAGKSAKISKEVDRMSKSLRAAQDNLKAIDTYRAQRNGFFASRKEMHDAKAGVDQAARALANAAKPTKALEQSLRQAQRRLDEATGAFERNQKAVLNSRAALTQGGVGVSKLIGEQARLTKEIDRTTAAMNRQARFDQKAAGLKELTRYKRAELAHQRAEAVRIEAGRRASASGDMLRGMGGIGARQGASLADSRRLIDGMGAPARAERRRLKKEADEAAAARKQRREDRREAGTAIGAGAAIATSHRGKDFAKSAIESAAEFDLAVRKQKVFTDITPEGQAGLLAQAKRIGQETQFSNIDVVKAQTASMQGLPANFAPDLKAAVAEGIVGNVRNFSTLMETDLKDGTEIIRGYLQQSAKDISTKEKALSEANKATNQLVKMAKLGGMNGEDVGDFLKFGMGPAVAAGMSPEATMSLGALARRGGLRGSEAGVAVRSMASKIVAPTDKGIAALNAAGIKYSDFVHMPDKVSTAALEGHFQNKLGKGFSPAIRKRLDAINSDKSLLGDRGKYTEAVVSAVGGILGKTKKGTVRASDSAKAAKAVGDFHKVSAQSVDAEGLLDAAFKAQMTLPQLNAWLTDKHGGKGAITQRQWDEYHASKDAIGKAAEDPDWARKKADEVFAGVGGAVENLKGSFENLILTVGNANASLIKWSADKLGSGLDSFSQLPEGAQQGLSLGAMGGATVAGWWGTMKLVRLALGLGGGASTGAGAAAGGAAVGAVTGGAAAGGTAAAGAGGAAAGLGTAVIVGGIAGAGALADMATPGAPGLLTGGDASLRQTMQALAREREGAAAAARLGYPGGWTQGGAKSLPGAPGTGAGYSTGWETSRGVIGDFLYGKEKSSAVLPGFGSGAKTIPVEIVSMRTGADPSGQSAAINNTLERAAGASATAANGGKPIEATLKPDQLVAKVTELPPVSGSAEVAVQNQVNVVLTLNEPMLQAKVDAAAGRAVAKIPLSSSGARPGAVSMPGAATTPGAK